MYGTVMVGTLADGVTLDDYDVAAKQWLQRKVDGFVDEFVMHGDSDDRIVMAVRFRDKAAYDHLADDPGQDEFYAAKLRPLLAAEPQWIDGEWIAEYHA